MSGYRFTSQSRVINFRSRIAQTFDASTPCSISSIADEFSLDSSLQLTNDTLPLWNASDTDEPVVRKAAGTSGTIHYYHRNQQYSITAMTTSTGTVAERYAYTAYGQPTILNASGTVLTSSAVGNRYTYTGREWDETLGLHHFRARWMSPLAGRFLGRDPIGYDDGPSLYTYVGSCPGRWIDPYGLIRSWGDVFPDDDSKSEGDRSTPSPFTTDRAAEWAMSRCYLSCFSCKAILQRASQAIGNNLASEIEVKSREAAKGLPDRQNSAVRHCVAGGLMAIYLGCSCAQCLEDYRDIAQWYSGTQPWGNTIQALHNDREGRWCGGCLGGRGDMDPLTILLPSEQEIIDCCKRKLRNGTLITGRRRPNSPYIDPEVPEDWWNSYGKPKITFPGLVW